MEKPPAAALIDPLMNSLPMMAQVPVPPTRHLS